MATGMLIGALATDGSERPLGFAGGLLDQERAMVALDCLTTEPAGYDELLALAVACAQRSGARRIEIWRKPSSADDDGVLAGLDAKPYRALHQMRCSLQVDSPAVDTRPFRSGEDDEALVRVNNRAFAHHPVQGSLDLQGLRSDMTAPWFDPEGIRLHEIDGQLAGFCWTKRHTEPKLGEIYVICVDPDFHGRGLGRPVTAAGLDWLAKKGETTGMLYVEADNVPAIRTYEGLGFEIVRTDRAWVIER